jgi:hypothetical protein
MMGGHHRAGVVDIIATLGTAPQAQSGVGRERHDTDGGRAIVSSNMRRRTAPVNSIT